MENKYTVRDIAKLAGVSVATVSRVLNNSEKVSDETREKVKKVIEDNNFIPNGVARSFHTKRSKIIGCILPDITNYYFSRMFLELEKQAHLWGYTLFLCNSTSDLKLESQYVNNLLERRVDGIILLGGHSNRTVQDQEYSLELARLSKHVPLVVINGKCDAEDAYIINTDEEKAVDQMVKYLVDRGHRSIGYIGGIQGVTVTDDKAKFFRQATSKYGINEENILIIHNNFNAQAGYNCLKELVRKGTKLPSAVMTINDEVAFGILRACHELGISVPDQLAVFGYDNVRITEHSTPSLTTYSHPYQQIGKKVIQTMNHLIEGETCKKFQKISGHIVERESV